MDFPLEQDQESGQVEARCVSYHMFKLKYHSKYVSCFDLIFLKSTGGPLLMWFFENMEKKCVSRKPCKPRSDLLPKGQMRVPE